ILSTTMRRAYRRSINDADLQRPLRFFREASRDGFDAGYNTRKGETKKPARRGWPAIKV
ncbi:MAG: DUF1595 domain-containing protein, partial [Candidatus Doudnabacteria bacterium]|nr:DUF1595 domain-containing protein [Candidatus Doudnabacteria bacterium]